LSKQVTILGAGFIGINLAKTLLKNNFRVSVLDRGDIPGDLTSEQLTWHKGFAENKEHLLQAITGSDYVFHLMSSTVPGDKVSVSNELFSGVSQIFEILNVCEELGVSQFMFMSSSSVYGCQQQTPITESVMPEPISTHGIQKLTLEHYVRLFSRDNNISCKVLRLSNPYGPGQDIYGRQGFISIVIGKLLKQEPVYIRGKGEAVRDYIHISDVCNICIALLENPTEDVIFNIGSGEGVSLNSLLSVMEDILGKPIQKQYVAARSADIPSSILSMDKLHSVVPYQPKTSLYDGLKSFLHYHGVI